MKSSAKALLFAATAFTVLFCGTAVAYILNTAFFLPEIIALLAGTAVAVGLVLLLTTCIKQRKEMKELKGEVKRLKEVAIFKEVGVV